MNYRVRINAGNIIVKATLNDSQTAEAIWQALPLRGLANLWGEEIYFSVPVHIGLENPQETVSRGDLAYWPDGPAICLFFGPTPLSLGDEIRPASPVNVFGRIECDVAILKKVPHLTPLFLSRENAPQSQHSY
jgi:hypothetical protein